MNTWPPIALILIEPIRRHDVRSHVVFLLKRISLVHILNIARLSNYIWPIRAFKAGHEVFVAKKVQFYGGGTCSHSTSCLCNQLQVPSCISCCNYVSQNTTLHNLLNFLCQFAFTISVPNDKQPLIFSTESESECLLWIAAVGLSRLVEQWSILENRIQLHENNLLNNCIDLLKCNRV